MMLHDHEQLNYLNLSELFTKLTLEFLVFLEFNYNLEI
jgi:hypothetical protein